MMINRHCPVYKKLGCVKIGFSEVVMILSNMNKEKDCYNFIKMHLVILFGNKNAYMAIFTTIGAIMFHLLYTTRSMSTFKLVAIRLFVNWNL